MGDLGSLTQLGTLVSWIMGLVSTQVPIGQSMFELLCENQRLIKGNSDNKCARLGPLGSRSQDRITSANSVKDKEGRRVWNHKRGREEDWAGEPHTTWPHSLRKSSRARGRPQQRLPVRGVPCCAGMAWL